MKTNFLTFVLCVVAVSCNTLKIEEKKEGKILLSMNERSVLDLKNGAYTLHSELKSEVLNLDTNKFNLSIYSQDGIKVYEGKYGKKPQEIVVTPGAYDIKLYSDDFNTPAFAFPLFGDEQTVLVEENEAIVVKMLCKQLNAGMRLSFTDDFKKKFPGTGVKLKDMNGEISYPYSVYDYCYFKPGPVELLYSRSSGDTLLFTRPLSPAQMISLNLIYSPGNSNQVSAFKVELDTVRMWETDHFNVGLKIPTGALTIEQAKERVGEKNITVFGFILAGDATTTAMRIAPPFTSKTNIVIASSMLERNRNNCFVVELPSGKVRDGLNLVENAHLLGSAVIVTGEIASSYYGYTGIKGTKSYSILY